MNHKTTILDHRNTGDATLIGLTYALQLAIIRHRSAIGYALVFSITAIVSLALIAVPYCKGVEISGFVWSSALAHCFCLTVACVNLQRASRNKYSARRAVVQHLIRVYDYPNKVMLSVDLKKLVG